MSDFAPILSPEAPEDLYAVPYPKRKAAEALPLNATQRASIADAGLVTLADVDVWLARGNTFDKLGGVGKVTAEKIQAAYDALQETKSWLK